MVFGFGKRKGPTLGLDINSGRITVLQFDKTKMGMEITRYASVATPPNTVREGLIADPETIGSLLRDVLEGAGIPLSPPPVVNIAVPGQSVVIRLMPVPTGMPPDELADVVAQEAINHVPFPMSEANLDWSMMQATERTDADGVRRVDVILAAIQKAIVDTYWRMTESAGVTLGKIDTSSMAVIRALSLAGYLGHNEQLTMSVNIRHDATDINLIKSGMPLFSRSVLLGLETLEEAVSRSLEIHLEDSLELLPQIQLFGRSQSATDQRISQAVQIARTVFGDITDEVGRSLEFYRSQVGEVQIDQIVLCGAGCVVPQIEQFIANRLNINTVVANPFRDVIYDSSLVPQDRLAAQAIPMGVVIDPDWMPVATVDLDLNKEGPSAGILETVATRPTVRITAEETPWFKPALAGGIVILLVITALWAYVAHYEVPKKQKELAEVKAAIDTANNQLKDLDTVKDQNNQLRRKKQLLDSIITHGQPLAAILQVVSENTPSGVQVKKLFVSGNSVGIEGAAVDFLSVSNLAVNLNDSRLLTDSTVDWAKRDETTDPRVIGFSVTAKLRRAAGSLPAVSEDLKRPSELSSASITE